MRGGLVYWVLSVSDGVYLVGGGRIGIPAKRTTAPALGLLTRVRAVFESRGSWVRET